MEFILLAIIVLQFIYTTYKDVLYSREREKLRVMIKSKDVAEYSGAVSPQPEEGKSVEDPYVPLEEMSIDMIVEAEEKL